MHRRCDSSSQPHDPSSRVAEAQGAPPHQERSAYSESLAMMAAISFFLASRRSSASFSSFFSSAAASASMSPATDDLSAHRDAGRAAGAKAEADMSESARARRATTRIV